MNLEAIVRPELDTGIPGGPELIEFAEAVIGTDRSRLDAARDALAAAVSPATVVGASAIAGNFSKNDRIANAIGIPVAESDLEPTREIRERLGLNAFRSAQNTFRHYPDR